MGGNFPSVPTFVPTFPSPRFPRFAHVSHVSGTSRRQGVAVRLFCEEDYS